MENCCRPIRRPELKSEFVLLGLMAATAQAAEIGPDFQDWHWAPGVMGWLAVVALLVSLVWLLRVRSRARRQRAVLKLYRTGQQVISDAVISIDSRQRIRSMNDAAERLVGLRFSDVERQPWTDVFALRDIRSGQPLGDAVLNPQINIEQKACIVDVHGVERRLIVRSTVAVADGKETLRMLVLQLATSPFGAALDLLRQSNRDGLTGVASRHQFVARLQLLLDDMAESEECHALLMVDLDRFKAINLESDRAAGDEYLRHVVTVLRNRVRESDLVARTGGDEFAVLLQACPMEQALRIANAIRMDIGNFRMAWNLSSLHVNASIGLVPIEHGEIDAESLMNNATESCSLAKAAGGDQVRVFQDHNRPSFSRRDLNVVESIQNALEQERFRLYRQPIQALRGGDEKLGGHFELLVRMLSNNGQPVMPNAFIPAAERHNLMQAIDRWVVATAFRAIEKAKEAAPGLESEYAINLSGASINDARFHYFVMDRAEFHGIVPATICFELTETQAVANLARAAETIYGLKAEGFHFALDDFGAGMCSFAYLKHLPVDYLKIDGSFVRDMVNQPPDFEIVSAINNIGHAMGMKTIAEFVEDQETLDQLRQIGVDYAQGWLIGKPVVMPAG